MLTITLLCKLVMHSRIPRFPQTWLVRTSLSEILKMRQCLHPNPFPFPNLSWCLPSRKLYPLIRNYPREPIPPTLLGALREGWTWEGAGQGSWSGGDPCLVRQRSGWAQALSRNVSKPQRGPDRTGAAASGRRQSRPSHRAMGGRGVEARGRTRQLSGSRSEPATSWETWNGTWGTGPSCWGEDERCKRERVREIERQTQRKTECKRVTEDSE